MEKMIAQSVSAPAKPRRSPEWFLAVILTVAVVALHFYFLTRAGGLWRDEVNSLNVAQGSWSQISRDSFPILFPTLLRGWCALGGGGGDVGLRLFGVLMGLSITAAFWLAAWWLRRLPPLWSLLLGSLNAWVIYYDASLRAYGLGSALIALCGGAAWNFLQQPGKKSWLLFAAMATLSVQTLYQNTALVAAICAGAGAVLIRQKNFKGAGGIFLAGLVAAISLLPYVHSIAGITHATAPVRTDFNCVNALTDLGTLLAFPLAPFFWVWLGLIGAVFFHAATGFFSTRRADRSLFAAVTLGTGFFAFLIFLRLANFFVQPWYFLPLLGLAAVVLENALPRLAGKGRSLLWGGVLATALLSVLFAVRVLDYRFTNLDALAKKVSAAAQKNDFAVVKTWSFGLTFGHYFTNVCAWNTVPPLADHAIHRYDLLAAQMADPDALEPLLKQVGDTLRSGNAVWIVGDLGAGTNAPLAAPGWNEMVSIYNWNNRLDGFLRQHSRAIRCVDAGTNEGVNFIERTALFQASGWRE
jgi:hypothetical protein